MAEARIGFGATVYLEGVEMCRVTSLNIAEGWVECFATSPSGYCNKDIVPDEFNASRIYGHIEVEYK